MKEGGGDGEQGEEGEWGEWGEDQRRQQSAPARLGSYHIWAALPSKIPE